jgi:hypothetical protein
MADYLPEAVAAFERRHGSKPSQVVIGLSAAIALAKAGQLRPECDGVKVVARPLEPGERPVRPGGGTKLFVSYELRAGEGRLEAFELA